MNDLAKQFEKIMTRLDPWYEKDMPDWIWNDVIASGVLGPGSRAFHSFFVNVWKNAHGKKKMMHFIDGYDEWLTAFEEYQSSDESVVDGLNLLAKEVDATVATFEAAYDEYESRAIASPDAPLGAVPFATRMSRCMYIEPNTKVEDELDDALASHYDGNIPISNKSAEIDLLKKLNRSKAYGDLFSPPVGRRVYRGLNVSEETLYQMIGKDASYDVRYGTQVNVKNLTVKPKMFNSWTLDAGVAKVFTGSCGSSNCFRIVITTKIDEKNASAFILNPKLGRLYDRSNEHETVQIKPVRIDSIMIL